MAIDAKDGIQDQGGDTNFLSIFNLEKPTMLMRLKKICTLEDNGCLSPKTISREGSSLIQVTW